MAQGDDVDTFDIDEIAMEYAQARERFIVEGSDIPLTTWLCEEAGIPIPTDDE